MNIPGLEHIDLQLVEKVLNLDSPSKPLIAGGFVRDLILGIKPRDADIYIEDRAGLREELTALGLSPSTPITKYGGKHIKTIYTDGSAVEVMIVGNTPSQVIQNSFDYGICMVAMDGKGQIFVTPAFNQDVRAKTITCYIRPSLTPGQIGKSLLLRSQKLRSKFPEMEFAVDVRYEEDSYKDRHFELLHRARK
jgi:hypothetical protein